MLVENLGNSKKVFFRSVRSGSAGVIGFLGHLLAGGQAGRRAGYMGSQESLLDILRPVYLLLQFLFNSTPPFP